MIAHGVSRGSGAYRGQAPAGAKESEWEINCYALSFAPPGPEVWIFFGVRQLASLLPPTRRRQQAGLWSLDISVESDTGLIHTDQAF